MAHIGRSVSASVRNRTAAWFGIHGHAGRILPRRGEVLHSLAVDQGRNAFFRRELVAALEGFAEFIRRADVFAVGSNAFRHLVIAQVLLEEIQVHRAGRSDSGRPHAPAVIIVNDADHGQLVLGRRIELEQAVGDARVAADADGGGAFVGGLRADAALHGGTGADHHRQVRSDRTVLIGADNALPRSKSPLPAAEVHADRPTAAPQYRLLGIDV